MLPTHTRARHLNPIRAWHFVGDTLRDGRPVPADGVWLKHEGDVKICRRGLHASRDPLDALQYAPGTILCLVEVRDVVEEQSDKLVARERKIVARMDATEMLGYFARMQALSVVHLWEAPDVVLDYLMTGDEAIRQEARDAAYGADAAHAYAAATAAAAVTAVAYTAAYAAVTAAAYAAAYTAAYARAEFNALVYECFEGVR